jgi:aminoglycoside/choline kinase family phosphotransferase
VTYPTLQQIALLTAERFPQYSVETLGLEPLEKGGSDRKFYRVRAHGVEPLIFVQYGQLREENRHYVEIGAFLAEAGVRVPAMHLHEEAEGRIWMEDLGDTDLWACRNQPWAERRGLYEATLREVRRLHTAAARLPEKLAALQLQPAFDARLYDWEQQYFFTHCLGRHFGIKEVPAVAVLAQMAAELAELPRLLVHRDFQSQNIVLKAGVPCLIDFQGMRFGLPQYDLASLLLDPYVDLSEEEQAGLLAFYMGLARGEGEFVDEASFERTYWLCAAQRLMQALGAYGFLGYERGRADFLAHIPVALPRLLAVWARLDGLQELAGWTAEAARRAGLRIGPDGGTY